MSELKAITAYEANWKATSNGDNSVLVYLKSEADKVIAEKDAEIAELKQEIERLKEENEMPLVGVNLRSPTSDGRFV